MRSFPVQVIFAAERCAAGRDYSGSGRGSPKWGKRPRSKNQVMAEMRSPCSVSTNGPSFRSHTGNDTVDGWNGSAVPIGSPPVSQRVIRGTETGGRVETGRTRRHDEH